MASKKPAKKKTAEPVPFGYDQQNCKVTHCNLRFEKHGKELKPACDLTIEIQGSNALLGKFDPELIPMLYTDQEPDADQDVKEFAGMEKLDRLRYREIAKPIELTKKLEGALVTFPWGRESQLEFSTAKVNKFRVEPKDAGYCVITFRVQSVFEKKDAQKLLGIWSGGETTITVEAAQKDMFDEDGVNDDAKASDKKVVPFFGKKTSAKDATPPLQ